MASYLVTQATGQQSQWVIAHLLKAGLKVHAVVRDLQKVPPNLKDPRIELFQGESKNVDDIFRAAQGCKGAFLNTFPIPGLESQQARSIVEACQKAGVETLVASTSFLTEKPEHWDANDAAQKTGLHEYYVSKTEVENIVRGSTIKSRTILRPGVIYQDLMLPGVYGNFPELPAKGELAHCLDDGVILPWTDAGDVGAYAAAALQDPARFGGHEININSQSITIDEVHRVLVSVVSDERQVTLRKRSPSETTETAASVVGQRFHLLANSLNFGTLEAEGKETQAKFGMPFTSLVTALQREKARLLECLPVS